MDGRPILPSGCVGWWIYIVYNIFIPPRARELLLYLYMTTHFNITISFPRLAFFFFSSLFFFLLRPFICLICTACLSICFFFLLFFSSFEKKSLISFPIVSRAAFPPTQSLNPAYLKAQAL